MATFDKGTVIYWVEEGTTIVSGFFFQEYAAKRFADNWHKVIGKAVTVQSTLTKALPSLLDEAANYTE